jgi:hypothetical protein
MPICVRLLPPKIVCTLPISPFFDTWWLSHNDRLDIEKQLLGILAPLQYNIGKAVLHLPQLTLTQGAKIR